MSSLWIYGGFIKDLVVHGDVHPAMDLDVGLPQIADCVLKTSHALIQASVIRFEMNRSLSIGPPRH